MFFAVDGAEHIEVVQLFVGKEIQDLPGRTTGGASCAGQFYRPWKTTPVEAKT